MIFENLNAFHFWIFSNMYYPTKPVKHFLVFISLDLLDSIIEILILVSSIKPNVSNKNKKNEKYC